MGFSVGFNLANSWWRRQLIERRYRSSQPSSRDIRYGYDVGDAVAVRAAVASLPHRQRAALIARYFADLSVAETAELLGCAPGTVKALTSQAISRLQASFGVEIVEEEKS